MNRSMPPKMDVYVETERLFSGWVVGDTKKAFESKAYVGSAILALCAVDALGGLYAEKP